MAVMKVTCTKKFADIPWAHRAPNHDGHCAWIHGHNWDITITFAAVDGVMDENGFVIDFGKLGFIKNWIAENLDHSCLFNSTDTSMKELEAMSPDMMRVNWIDDCSCEGTAAYLFHELSRLVRGHTNGRVIISELVLHEDKKNFATVSL